MRDTPRSDTATVEPEPLPAPLSDDPTIDLGRLFIPEELTPLSFTSSYRELTSGQRLRYNQLHALYFNEQILFFETVLLGPILDALQREPWPRGLAAGLAEFRAEERQHSEMFRRLNRRCAPWLYARGDHHFIRMPAVLLAVLGWAVRHPLLFPLFLWLMLLQEERSIFYSRTYLRHRGSLEPSFVAVHRRHVADEVGHVRWDEQLLDALWLRSSRLRRAVNARLFAWLLEEFFGAPKRGQLEVVAELVLEHPELGELAPKMRTELLALGDDEAFRASLYSRSIVPRTFARFDSAPELRRRGLCGYRPMSAEGTP